MRRGEVPVLSARLLAAIGLVAVAAAATGWAQAPPAPGPQFRTGVDIVVVEATVHDRSGAVAEGLGPADFKVEIDGRAREIVSADLVRYATAAPGAPGPAPSAVDLDVATNRPAVTGRTVLIVIDHASLRVESHGMIEAASRWVGTLGASDRVGVMVLPLPGLSVEFTTDHARVRDGLARVKPLGKPPQPFSYRTVSPYEAIRITEDDTFVTQQVITRECRGGEPYCPDEIRVLARSMKLDAESAVMPLLGSLRAVMKAMGALPGPKHAVLLSSGWLMTARDAAIEIATVAAEAAVSNVTIHTFTSEDLVPTASQRRPSPTPGQDRDLLVSTVEMVSGMTGGRAVRMASKGDLAFASLTAGLGGYYRLGVRAQPADLDGRPHQISLKVTRSGTRLAGHRRVLAATAKAPAAPVDAATALRAALESPTPELGFDVRASAYVLHADGGSRNVRVVVVGDVAGAAAGSATVVAALYDLEGRPATAMENAIHVPSAGAGPMTVELTVPGALYVLRVAVRDAEGRVGSVEHPVDARWKQVGGVATPGLVLFRSAIGGPAPSGLVLDEVTTAEQVIAQVAVSRATDRTTPIVFALTPAGSAPPVATRAATIAETTAGALVARATIPAATLAPGRYTLTATIGSAAPAFSRAFSVVAAAGHAPAAIAPR